MLRKLDTNGRYRSGRPSSRIGFIFVTRTSLPAGNVEKKIQAEKKEYWAVLVWSLDASTTIMNVDVVNKHAVPYTVFLVDLVRCLIGLGKAVLFHVTSRQQCSMLQKRTAGGYRVRVVEVRGTDPYLVRGTHHRASYRHLKMRRPTAAILGYAAGSIDPPLDSRPGASRKRSPRKILWT